MVWTGRHTQCGPMLRIMISRHRRSLALQSPHLWPLSNFVFSTVFHDKCSVHAVHACERELVSLSLRFTQITCNNEHQCCQIIIQEKDTFVVIHLCSISPFSVFWCVRIQHRLTSCHSFSILLCHIGKILILSFTQGGQRQHVHPGNPSSVSRAM